MTRRELARAASDVEAGGPIPLPPRDGGAIIGVTGAPGAGKSTLVNQLIRVWRKHGRTVAVIAVDPSSEATGGAILGDRIRMQDHHGDDGVFVRSMAARGGVGALAASTPAMAELFRRAGYDIVVVETVGAGQSDTRVSRIASATAVVVTPGTGDDIQAMKAGILEIADVFVVNKADYPGAPALEADLRDRGGAPVVRTIASTGAGVEQLTEVIDAALDSNRPVR